MKNKNTLWLILGGILILGLVLLVILTSKPKKTNEFTFPKEVIVNNYTKYKGVDTMAMVVLNKIMLYDSINMNIRYFNISTFDNGLIKTSAFVDKNQFKKHTYNLYLNINGIEGNLTRIISHELSHIQQMERGDLIQILLNQEYCIYKNDTIYYSKVPYENRSFEIDAFKQEQVIESELIKLLYKK